MGSFVPWMTQLDERILEQFATDGAAISWELRFDRRYSESRSRDRAL